MITIHLAAKFAAALSYPDYLATGTDEQKRRWTGVYEAVRLSDPQLLVIAGFIRRMHVLVVSGIWCGDCVEQVPLLARIAEANPEKIGLRIVDRDQHRDLADQLKINLGDRVPVAIFMAEDFAFCSLFGDRSLSRYRAIAIKKLGASCPIAITPPAAGETNATLADWLNEFERVQLMLRLSNRLRQIHGD
jgi:thiol-disulfide isomerase/thioredoxin